MSDGVTIEIFFPFLKKVGVDWHLGWTRMVGLGTIPTYSIKWISNNMVASGWWVFFTPERVIKQKPIMDGNRKKTRNINTTVWKKSLTQLLTHLNNIIFTLKKILEIL